MSHDHLAGRSLLPDAASLVWDWVNHEEALAFAQEFVAAMVDSIGRLARP